MRCENAVATFAYEIMLSMNRLRGNDHESDRLCRASGYIQSLTKNPHETGMGKGNVKIRRKIRRPSLIEKIGSSGWIRTGARHRGAAAVPCAHVPSSPQIPHP
jgi:hypothetical protein